MIVVGLLAEAVDAELEADVVVDGKLHGLAYLLVVVGLVVDVHAHGERRRGADLGLHQVHSVEDLDIVRRGLVVGMDFTGVKGVDLGRRIGAVVDELDAVEVGIPTPPLALLAPLEDDAVAHVVGNEIEGAGADRVLHPVRACLVEGRVNDQGGVVGDAGDDGHVGLVELQLDRLIVDLLERALTQLLGLRIDQCGHALGHRVALDGGIAPAADIVDHVVGAEGVAVVPCHALADMEGIFGRVVVHLPAFQQAALEGEVARELDQRLERLAHRVGNFGPVGQTRILVGLAEHRNLDHAALLGRRVLRYRRCRRGETDHAVRHRGRRAEDAGHGQKLASADVSGLHILGHRDDMGRNAITVTFVRCHSFLPLLAFRLSIPHPAGDVKNRTGEEFGNKCATLPTGQFARLRQT